MFKSHTKVILTLVIATLFTTPTLAQKQTITFNSLLEEMANLKKLAQFPQELQYKSLQASSYNRLSTNRKQKNQNTRGWFADSDGIGFIRTEKINNKKEWVIMEHEGPGALTRFWTPFFYYNFNERTGPNIKIYLDGNPKPVIDTPLIHFVTEKSFVTKPFSRFTARGGVCYLPIPFAKSCKVTLTSKAFYNIINYRAYPKNTPIKSFTKKQYDENWQMLDATSRKLLTPAPSPGKLVKKNTNLTPEKSLTLNLNKPGAIRELKIQLDPKQIKQNPKLLRQLILKASFDNNQTIWVPIGDFFGSPNKVNPIKTLTRTSSSNDKLTFTCSWVMPFKQNATLTIQNLSDQNTKISLSARVSKWKWNKNSMHFHANWKPDLILPGTPFIDYNFVKIKGKGVFVGDQWTVLNPDRGWWGEGDEKIYVDDAWNKGFPDHFGTGTEDYYGWAGGVNPTKKDTFSIPFGSNSVGSTKENNSRGFNICSRIRTLDAIPFNKKLTFDIEASPGVEIRNKWNLLGYSSVAFWYAIPGSTNNTPPKPKNAIKPIMSLKKIEAMQEAIREQE